MSSPWRPGRLQLRLSVLLLVLLLAVGGLYVALLSQLADRYVAEDLQRRNRGLAASVAAALHLNEGTHELSAAAVRKLFDAAMTVNPYIKLYFLDIRTGRILNASAKPAEVRLTQVPLEPVRALLAGRQPLPIFGTDPRHPGQPQPFSAALLHTASGPHYLYITLAGDPAAPPPADLRRSHILQVLLRTLAVAGLAVLLVGLLLIALLTRNLDRLAQAVRCLQHGDYSARVTGIRGHDELSNLAEAFNDMAARTEQAVGALHRADALRREVMANISHDLRTPLTSIEGYAETILHPPYHLADEERQRYAGTILTNTRHLKRMVSELFELSKLEGQQALPHPEPLSLAELVQDVLLKLAPQAQAANLHLHPDWGAAGAVYLPMVCADAGLLERVLQNLLDNALLHTPAGGQVWVRLLPAAGSRRLGVEVSDSGRGIAAADLPFVFDRFYRAPRVRTSQQPGLGLGLAIARRIVALHGGELTVRSIEGEGTCFAFSLPVYRAEEY
ncbi:sensor histidine kinase [Hymenobacter terricola]|uniref:sensor histidine kinase n=1 Tax=Hymenobacter terricola TaxID=2819236 RepID=UPI001B30A756|nr:HAMP domain-containing sensor histidine kinase [Hymenobacter terricola]